MVTQLLHLTAAEPFWFEDTIFAHGWVRLLPYRWDEESQRVLRTEWLPSGRCAAVSVRSAAPGAAAVGIRAEVTTEDPLSAADEALLRAGLRRACVLDERLEGWWRRCAEEPGLRRAHERRQGRMLRSPTVFEDVVKTVCSINTTWAQTKQMVRNLVSQFGPGDPSQGDEGRAFPTAAALAAADPALLRERARVGYRAGTLVGIARSVIEGRLDLEGLQDPDLADEAVTSALASVRGLGPYAVAHMMMLLGRYDFLPVDTWLRRTVTEAWFGGRAVPDHEIVAEFERFRPYRSLAFRFYDWQGALRREVWTEQD